MSSNASKKNHRLLTGGLVLAVVSGVYAQEKPYSQPGTALPVPPPPPPKPSAPADSAAAAPAVTSPEPNAVDKFFNGKIPDAIAKGKFSVNARLRYEWVD